jgi:hypothetical protein
MFKKAAICFAAMMFIFAASRAQSAVKLDPSTDITQYYSAIGTSDLIVLGAIKDSKIPELPTAIPKNSTAIGVFSFQVEKVLKGNADTTTFSFSCPLKLFVSNEGTEASPKYVIRGWSPDISKDQRVILFLQRSQGGYSLTYKSYLETYSKSFVPDTAEEQVGAAIKQLPAAISLTMPADVIPFGTKATGKVIVKNTGDKSIQLTGLNYEGFYLSAKLDRTLAINTIEQNPTLQDADGKPKPLTLKPGEQVSFTLGLSTGQPQSWALFDSDSGLLTPIALRAICSLSIIGDDGKTGPGILASSPWQMAITGFAPPAPFDKKAQ